MNLLAPWFLAGAALIAGPIIAHLIRRATRERVAFSGLRFLGASAPPLDRRSRIQHPALLGLRCLVVVLFAFGFARPFLEEQTPAAGGAGMSRHVVAVLDESASMRREGLWEAAREKVISLAARLGAGDRFALLSAGDSIKELIGSAQWMATAPRERAALVRGLLAERAPGWGPTPLDAAGEAALAQWEEMAEDAGGAAHRELVIVSDFAAGARTAGFARLDWPPDAQVRLEPVSPTRPGNASLNWLGWAEAADGTAAARIRLSRSFDAPERLSLQWFDAQSGDPLAPSEALTLLPGASEVRLVELPENAPESVRLALGGDAEPFDNDLWLVRSPPRELSIGYLAAHPADAPHHARFYLERAVRGWREPAATIVSRLPENLAAPALLVVPEPLAPSLLESTRARIEAGAFALVLLGSDAAVDTAAALANESGWQPFAPARDDALFGQLAFQHPLFAPFADPLYSDFTRIRFWNPRSVVLPPRSRADVVARFDDGSPAVLEVAVGRGRVIVWGGDWSPTASQWVLSSKFVPWLQALAERTVGGPARPAIVELGQPLSLRDGESVAAAFGAQPASADGSSAPAAPGIYAARNGEQQRLIALNVPAAESRLDPLPLDTWEQLGVPLRPESGAEPNALARASRLSASAAATEGEQQLWRWLLWLVVALLALESLLSYAIARCTTPATAAA